MSSSFSSLLQYPVISFRDLKQTVITQPVSKYRGRSIFEYNGFQVLAVADLPIILPADDDRIEELSKGEQYRPDLTSRRLYITPYLDWVIMRANNLSDPFTDYTVGKIIRIPSSLRTFSNIIKL